MIVREHGGEKLSLDVIASSPLLWDITDITHRVYKSHWKDRSLSAERSLRRSRKNILNFSSKK